MSCRLLVVALVLLASPPALAQSPDSFRVDAGPTWAVELDSVVGRSLDQRVACRAAWDGASSLATVRYQPVERLSLGVVVPFVVGLNSVSVYCAPPQPVFADLGELALFAAWEARIGHTTRVPVGLLVALPTALSSDRGDSSAPPIDALSRHAWFVTNTRGLDDYEFFHPGFLAVVPSVEVSHSFDRVSLSGSVKLPLLVNVTPEPAFASTVYGVWDRDVSLVLNAIVTGRAMFRFVGRPKLAFAGGLVLVGVSSRAISVGYPPLQSFGASVEPRLEARFSDVRLRAGLVVPVAFPSPLTRAMDLSRFPETWGVRVGVGYSF